MVVQATHTKHNHIDTLTALKIDRKQLWGEFPTVMDASQELSDSATTLFDEIGHLRPSFIEHEYQKGSGVWGRELDDGSLLYLPSLLCVGRGKNGNKKGPSLWTFSSRYLVDNPESVLKA